MLLAAHCPEFFPSLSFFEKMSRAETFVLLDDVRFDRESLQHRALIDGNVRLRWLTVPLQGRACSGGLGRARLGVEARGCWSRAISVALEEAYWKAPYFKLYWEPISRLLKRPWRRLLDLDEASIQFCRDALDIRTPLLRRSQLAFTCDGTEGTIRMCRKLGADAFICETGMPRSHVKALEQAELGIVWQDLEDPRRFQRRWPLKEVERLSILDLLFHCGPQSGLLLTRRHGLETAAT